MNKLILITGGERSGKSSYAERLALTLSENPVYVATARIWDEEFRLRVDAHKARRGAQWTNIEEPFHPGRHNLAGRVVLVDCMTLWATNFFFEESGGDAEARLGEKEEVRLRIEQAGRALQRLLKAFDELTSQHATFIVVTNEIGWGGVPVNPVQRRFTDMLGWANQHAAAVADEVICMISGIPVRIKG